MKMDSSIKVLSLGLAALFSSASFANDAIVLPSEVSTEYAITLTQEPTIVGSIFHGSTINCRNDFSEYSAKVVSNSDGYALQIVSGQRMDCRALIVRDFELDLDLYIDHPFPNSELFYHSLPLSNLIVDPYGTRVTLDMVQNHEWKLIEIDGEAVSSTATLEINHDAGISGNAGCNQFFGQSELKNNRLRVLRMGMTQMACRDMNIERIVSSVLSDWSSVSINNSQLTLKGTEYSLTYSYD
ncbi:META domain-containing protein [Shewanella sp. VB17]|uniref:META domain-containing protein n=1 Tax=Shewanella sp. VB17 TaxID=2739432 RepID=UPI001567C010|nr:META domain-containing protein [Shewanella sp. VB17]NRD73753.1 META domain-containing protein [Shewanella sp. VB17]